MSKRAMGGRNKKRPFLGMKRSKNKQQEDSDKNGIFDPSIPTKVPVNMYGGGMATKGGARGGKRPMGMMKGGAVGGKKKGPKGYAKGGKVRGAGIARKGVRPCKMR